MTTDREADEALARWLDGLGAVPTWEAVVKEVRRQGWAPSVPVSADREAGVADVLEAQAHGARLRGRDAVAAVTRLCEEGLRQCEGDVVTGDADDHAARYSAIRAALPALPPQEEQR